MEAGDYRHPVVIEKPNPSLTVDAYGQENLSNNAQWVVAFPDRAGILSLSSREFFSGDQVRADVTHKVYLRFSMNSVGITPQYRVKWSDIGGTRYLQVVQKFEGDLGRRRVVTLLCKEML